MVLSTSDWLYHGDISTSDTNGDMNNYYPQPYGFVCKFEEEGKEMLEKKRKE